VGLSAGAMTGLLIADLKVMQWLHQLDNLGRWNAVIWSPVMLLAVIMIPGTLQVGLMGVDFPDAGREWLSRFRAICTVYSVWWIALLGAAIYGPLLIWYLVAVTGKWASGITAGWVATTIAGILAGKSKKTGTDKEGAPKASWLQFLAEFPNDDACLTHIFLARWPEGRAMCDKCHVQRKHYRVTGRTAFACDRCGNHIYPLAGSIFEKSTTSLRIWFYAMYQIGSTRCGVSAKQIQRETGVTYKTAWRMFKQICTLMGETVRLEGSSDWRDRQSRWTKCTLAESAAMESVGAPLDLVPKLASLAL
jgi:transposase-like protein